MPPRAALSHERGQDDISRVVVASVRRLWRRMRGRTWSVAWRDDVGPQVARVIGAGQAAAAARADQYAAEVLAELDIPVRVPTRLLPEVFAGVAGDGRSVESLTYGAVVRAAKAQYSEGVDLSDLEAAQRAADDALDEAERYLADIAEGILLDTARAAEVASLAQRPWVTGWIRMIETGACSRCVVLAGKFYLWNDGFLRHPKCRCTHIPYAENIPDDERTNPDAYFASLSPAEQDHVFTVAGAEAIRLGADIGQVVNARRGMTTAQQNPRGWIPKGRLVPVDVFGRPTYVTTEGVTRRGSARRAMGQGRPVRLMPESILALAETPEDRVRLLELYGYITAR